MEQYHINMWPNALLQCCPCSNWEKQKEGELMCMPCQEHRPRAQLMKTTMAINISIRISQAYYILYSSLPLLNTHHGLSKSVVIKMHCQTEIHLFNLSYKQDIFPRQFHYSVWLALITHVQTVWFKTHYSVLVTFTQHPFVTTVDRWYLG